MWWKNVDSRKIALIAWCIGRFHATEWVECGILEGEGSRFWSRLTGRAIGCDVDGGAVSRCREMSKGMQVEAWESDSLTFLLGLNGVTKPIFYLDSNWREDWPGFAEIRILLDRWPNHVAIVNAVTISGHGNFIGRSVKKVTDADIAEEFGHRYNQILSPRYSTPEPMAGYVVLNREIADIPFVGSDFEDLSG